MKAKELNSLTKEELALRAQELSSDLFKARLQQAQSQLDKPSAIRATRRDIARVLTAARNK